jgi:hypothetical protein
MTSPILAPLGWAGQALPVMMMYVRTTCVILSSHVDVDVIIVRDSDQHQNLHDSRQGCIRYEPFAGVDRQQIRSHGTYKLDMVGASPPCCRIFVTSYHTNFHDAFDFM